MKILPVVCPKWRDDLVTIQATPTLAEIKAAVLDIFRADPNPHWRSASLGPLSPSGPISALWMRWSR